MERTLAVADAWPQTTTRAVRVLVVHELELVHLGLRVLLGALPWVERCVPAATVEEAFSRCRRYQPHVALVGGDRNPHAGLTICRRLHELSPAIRIVLLADRLLPPPKTLRSAGVVGVLPSGASLETVTNVLHDVAAGRPHRDATSVPPGLLLPREQEVLQQIASGATNREIASALFLHPDTVKRHARSALRKLGARNRAQAVARASRLGVLAWDETS